MCMSSAPSIPAPPPPPQAVKQPDALANAEMFKRNRNAAAMGGGTLLTGAGGIGAPSTGKASLLGS